MQEQEHNDEMRMKQEIFTLKMNSRFDELIAAVKARKINVSQPVAVRMHNTPLDSHASYR